MSLAARRVLSLAAVTFAAGLAAPALALIVPFTETFASPAANWSSALAFTPLTYPASGGPDGSGYASRSLSFANLASGEQPLIFRGQSNFNSSGNAFVGNWITGGGGGGVTEFSFSVRHDAPEPVDFFARFAPAAGPGIVALQFPGAQPGVWTTYTVAINPSAPFIYEGTTFAGVFANLARVQVGIIVSDTLAGQTPDFTFDIDNVSIVPAPGAAALIGLLALAGLRRRR
ncbi:MAG: hypothetical protein JNK35_06505 [Phycisphaerae bacterium]|nr:hypothetical protein [Phycisphaerae bacterium]